MSWIANIKASLKRRSERRSVCRRISEIDRLLLYYRRRSEYLMFIPSEHMEVSKINAFRIKLAAERNSLAAMLKHL